MLFWYLGGEIFGGGRVVMLKFLCRWFVDRWLRCIVSKSMKGGDVKNYEGCYIWVI